MKEAEAELDAFAVEELLRPFGRRLAEALDKWSSEVDAGNATTTQLQANPQLKQECAEMERYISVKQKEALDIYAAVESSVVEVLRYSSEAHSIEGTDPVQLGQSCLAIMKNVKETTIKHKDCPLHAFRGLAWCSWQCPVLIEIAPSLASQPN